MMRGVMGIFRLMFAAVVGVMLGAAGPAAGQVVTATVNQVTLSQTWQGGTFDVQHGRFDVTFDLTAGAANSNAAVGLATASAGSFRDLACAVRGL